MLHIISHFIDYLIFVSKMLMYNTGFMQIITG